MRRRHSIAEFSRRVSLLNEQENLTLKRTVSNLDIAMKYCLQSRETEIKRAKQKAHRLNFEVHDYDERKQGANYTPDNYKRLMHKGERGVGQSASRLPSPALNEQASSVKSGRPSSRCSKVSFQVPEDEDELSRVVRPWTAAGHHKADHSWSNRRPLSGSRSVDIHLDQRPHHPLPRPKPEDIMVNNCVKNHSLETMDSRPSTRKLLSIDALCEGPSAVSYEEIQSPYKVFQCTGKRSVSVLNKDSQKAFTRRKFVVVPRRFSQAEVSRPKSSLK